MSERPNIVFIVLDTVRYDHCSYSGYHLNTTPNIDNVENGIYFHSAYSTSTWSLPSYPSILTGLYPSQHGVHTGIGGHLHISSPTFVGQLKNRGYSTVAYSTNPLFCSSLGFDRGFDEFHEPHFSDFRKIFDPKGWNPKGLFLRTLRMIRRWWFYHIAYPKHEKLTLTNIRSSLSRLQEPFFLFLLFMDVHDYWKGKKTVTPTETLQSHNHISRISS